VGLFARGGMIIPVQSQDVIIMWDCKAQQGQHARHKHAIVLLDFMLDNKIRAGLAAVLHGGGASVCKCMELQPQVTQFMTSSSG